MRHRRGTTLLTIALVATTGCSAGASPTRSVRAVDAAPSPTAHATSTAHPTSTAHATSTAHPSTTAQPSTTANRSTTAHPSDLLVLRGATGASVIDSVTGRTVTTARNAIPAPGGAKLIRAAAGKLTAVDSRDSTATPLGEATAALVPVVTTRDGNRVALAEPAAGAVAEGYIAPGKTASRIAVTTGGGSPAVFDLDGNFEPEAFSSDGRLLFLVEYLPAAAPNRYRVRQLDLANGAVLGVLGPQKQVLEEEMRGIGRMQLLDEQRAVLYTLYRTIGSDRAFVHTLHLDGLWAHCIVLPEEFGRGGKDTKMAVAPNGTLYAWDGAHVSVVDGAEMAVRRTVQVRSEPTSGTVAVTVAADGTLITAGGGRVAEFDGATLTEKTSWPLPFAADAIATSIDDTRLFVSDGTRIKVIDRESRESVGQFPLTPGDRIAAVLSAHG